MRAFRLTDHRWTPVDEPTPTPGPGQVLVKVKAASLNHRDVLIRAGSYGVQPNHGVIPLSDGAGEVVALGDGVTRFAVGDRVVGAFLPGWTTHPVPTSGEQYSIDVDGWLAEHRAIPEEALAAIPDGVDHETAATLPCAATTAWVALRGVGEGDVVLTQGTGGVSLFVVQLAVARGARVVATTSTDAKAELVRTLGAEPIDRVAIPDWPSEVWTRFGGAHRVIEVGAGLAKSLGALRPFGEVALVAPSREEVRTSTLFRTRATVRSLAVGNRLELEAVAAEVARLGLEPVVDGVFDLEDAESAYERQIEDGRVGKVVVRVG
ncbi:MULTISPECIES: NAD(P)-dependent alcohol dehydrogenase [Actinosynnema]|uniref:zinc-dependent alcohol dehydrogenase family protein n=1 Tax=Actinosynnema TaxID=40566 RepID=UPI0020A24625|nr:NAD(P)-dependent alcohol dehydrogenase [Actinosynnema pretiosum]MCP2098267.1 D-arabinose 1-dehydrogenase, Zn-dependent alcohol dehydrogenase family [Actinosynnema pretiosum]